MTSSPERRKHGACLLRIRESCPFRKLKKNKCGVSSISEAVARRWGCSPATVPLLANPAEGYPQAQCVQPYFHLHHQQHQDHSAMDAEAAPSIAGTAFSSSHRPYTGPVPSATNLISLHQSSLSACDNSMELDNCVDPETGERAQG